MATNCPRTCYCGFLRRGLRLNVRLPPCNRTRRIKPHLRFGGYELPFILDMLVFEKGRILFGWASSWWGWRGGSCVRDVAVLAAFADLPSILFGAPAGCGRSVWLGGLGFLFGIPGWLWRGEEGVHRALVGVGGEFAAVIWLAVAGGRRGRR